MSERSIVVEPLGFFALSALALGFSALALGSSAGVQAQTPQAYAALNPMAIPGQSTVPATLGPDGEALFGREVGVYDPSGVALRPFHQALRRAEAGAGQAHVLVFGASHVAADFFTNVLRQRLQTRFGDAGHGFILPARPWRHYRHLGGISVRSSRRWTAHRVRAGTREPDYLGLAGVAVESDSRSAYGRIETGSSGAGRFEIYYLNQPGGGRFEIRLDGRRVRRVGTAAAEFSPGYTLVTAPDQAHTLEVRPLGDGPVRFFGVSVEHEVPGVVVDTLGVNGARSRAQLLWGEELYQDHLRRRRPDLVVLAYGTNESGDTDVPIEAYERRLREVVSQVRGAVPQSACLLVGPSDRPLRQSDGTYVDRPRTAAIIQAQARVSRDFGCAFFDLVAFGGGPLSMVQWAATDPAYGQRDLVHFTARGYRRLGEVLHGALMQGFDQSPAYQP